MPLVWMVLLMRNVRRVAALGLILSAMALICGCGSNTAITKSFENRIHMSKPEALSFLEQYLRNEQNLSIDETHVSFDYHLKIIDNIARESWGTLIKTTTLYHWQDYHADINYAAVVEIRKTSFVGGEAHLFVHDAQGRDLTGGGGLGWGRIDDRFISALLALCPNVKASAVTTDGLQAMGQDVAPELSEEIQQAIARSDTTALAPLLEANPDLVEAKTDYGHPLYIAAEKGNTAAAALLIGKGATVDKRTRKIDGEFTPLYIAAENGRKAMVELLLANGADVNAKTDRGFTALHIAAYYNRLEVMALLVAKGAGVNNKSNAKITPLSSAAENNSLAAASFLIAQGAVVDATGPRGFSALHTAVGNGYLDFADLLISQGADVNLKADFGYTPLYIAAEHNHQDVADLLIRHKADVNLQAWKGWTPLHIAVLKKHNDMVTFLITKGADVNAKNKEDATPLNLATHEGLWDIANLLRENGAGKQ